ncbi:MAG: hypothetical protein OXI16_03025 [Chloroflexota bacterium]|nr:hypothetical protein [Chloroflexota bacterium]
MIQEVRIKMRRRSYKVFAAVALLIAALGMILYTGFATDVALGLLYKISSGGAGAHPGYWGPTSLEERILSSDVIARVRLKAMSPSVAAVHLMGVDEEGNPVKDDY